MKQFFTLLFLLTISINLTAQDDADIGQHHFQELLNPKKTSSNNPLQANIRSPYGVDSSFYYLLPDNELSQRRYSTYNDLGSTVLDSIVKLNTNTNVWENYRKTEILRNPDDQWSVYTYLRWDNSSSDWVPLYDDSYSYNNDGKQIERVYRIWDNTTMALKNYLKWEYNYDSNGLNIDRYTSVWDSPTSSWEKGQYATFTYDSNGNVIEETSQIWLLNTYNNYLKVIIEYDTDQNLISSTLQLWNAINLGWENDEKREFIFVNNQFVAQYNSVWVEDVNGSDWQNIDLIQLSYDGNGNRTEALYSSYDFVLDDWVQTGKWVFYFSEITSAPIPEDTSVNCAFQNPIRTGQYIFCQDVDYTQTYQFLLLDISGKVLLEKTFSGDMNLELPSQLESGMYFANVLRKGKMVLRKKIVVAD